MATKTKPKLPDDVVALQQQLYEAKETLSVYGGDRIRMSQELGAERKKTARLAEVEAEKQALEDKLADANRQIQGLERSLEKAAKDAAANEQKVAHAEALAESLSALR